MVGPEKSPGKRWSCRPYEVKDLPAIGLFFKELYTGKGDYGDMGLFHWKIVDNYAQKGIINLIKDGDRVASTTSVTPKLLVLNNELCNAGEIGDTYTHPDYWRQGMFTLLINESRKDAEAKAIKFIYGTPNTLSLPGYQRKANFDIIENLHVRSLVFPTNIRARVQEKSNWILGIVIGSIFSLLWFLNFRIRNIFSIREKSIVVEEVGMIPDEWNDFWNRARQAYGFVIDRSEEAIRWRYFNNPKKYKFICLWKNNSLVGYMVFRLVHSEDGSTITIADYLTLVGEEAALGAGINHIIDRAFVLGVNEVGLWSVESGPYFRIFERKGFFRGRNIPIICYQNEFAKGLKNITSWHFTTSDSDNI